LVTIRNVYIELGDKVAPIIPPHGSRRERGRTEKEEEVKNADQEPQNEKKK